MEEIAVHESVHNITLNILVNDAIKKGIISSPSQFDSLYNGDGKRFDQIYPRWLWESLAVYEANQLSLFSTYMSLKDGFPSLETLNGSHNLVYNVGYTIVDFIIQQWGRKELLVLVKNNGDTYSALGVTELEFAKQWELYVRDKYWFL